MKAIMIFIQRSFPFIPPILTILFIPDLLIFYLRNPRDLRAPLFQKKSPRGVAGASSTGGSVSPGGWSYLRPWTGAMPSSIVSLSAGSRTELSSLTAALAGALYRAVILKNCMAGSP